jgi:hypothetical protein
MSIREILPGLYHWPSFHSRIQSTVHSYFWAEADPPILIDPMLPEEGVDWFAGRPPGHILLTNRHHYRHSDEFLNEYGAEIWCHEAGLHEFATDQPVRGFRHGDTLPGGIRALEVGVLCPEETALWLDVDAGVLAIADAIIRIDGELGFVPDWLLGDDPAAIKRGIKQAFAKLVDQPFDHLLFAHGEPWIGGGKKALLEFVAETQD